MGLTHRFISSSSTTGATTTTTTTDRLKRELCKSTRHDSEFSDWKILIGSSDWADYSKKKDNAPRYRTQNVPNCAACSGVYELGVTLSKSGQGGRSLSQKCVCCVYVGQADNVRNRLQQYGREGGHLEKGCSNLELSESKPLGLLTEIFSRDSSVVFRWAPMKSKGDAEKAEQRLLNTFDYAWNKENNGARRPNDIHKILDREGSRPTKKSISIKLKIIPPKKVGVKIRNCEPLMVEDRSSFYMKEDVGGAFFSRIFKFGKPRAIRVSKEHDDDTSICGVALGQGSVCTKPPVEGRKRCADHKGMKVNGCSRPIVVSKQLGLNNDHTSICGVALGQGSVCSKPPVEGRKRCADHKGMKVNGCSRPNIVVSKELGLNNDHTSICGVALGQGSVCTMPPVKGRKRCAVHKGMKVNGSTPKLIVNENRSFCIGSPLLGHEICEEMKVNEDKSKVGEPTSSSLTCGAVTLKGSRCKRKPGKGGIWCWQHEPKMLGNEIEGNRCSRQVEADREVCWQHLINLRLVLPLGDQMVETTTYCNGIVSFQLDHIV